MNLFARAISTGVLWISILAVIVTDWLPGYYIIVPALGGIGVWEFYKVMDSRGVRVFKKSGTFSGVIFLIGCIYILGGNAPAWLDFISFEVIGLILVLLGILSRQVFDRTQPTPVVSMAVTLFGLLYVVWLFSFVVHVRFFPTGFPQENFSAKEGSLLLIYLLVVAKMHDAGAMLTGKFFGRNKMIPNLSPKKTWEGFTGGLLVAMGSSALLVILFPTELGRIGTFWSWPLGLLLGLMSVVGDLAESVIKRDSHVKDSGHVIPGIGGVLDLIDSILFSAPVLYLFLKIQHVLVTAPDFM